MKLSFFKYLLDKIKFVFLTIFNCCLVILPKFGKHTVQRIEDTEYYEQDRDTNYIQAQTRPTTSTYAKKMAAEEKINRSTNEQRKEEKLVQREEKGLVKNFNKKDAVTKIKQKIEKYQEKLKDVKRDSKKQRSILRDITKGKPVKIEICHEPLKMDAAEQMRTRAILRDFPKIATFRIEKNHEHHKEKKYREYKAQEILMNVTMSEAEKMRAAIKNYSAQQREKREEKRRNKATADMIREASISRARKKEKIYEQYKEKKNLEHRTREIFKDVCKNKPMEIEEKLTVYCEPKKKQKYYKDISREMSKDLTKTGVVQRKEKVKRGFELGQKRMSSDLRENFKADGTNDKSQRKRLEKLSKSSKSLTTCNEVDIKKKTAKYVEPHREVKPVLGGANEIVKKVSKTYGIKEKMEMVKHSPEKVDIQLQRNVTMIIKDDRQQNFNTIKDMETKEEGQKELHRAATITMENNKTSNEIVSNQKKPLQRDATVIIKSDITKTKIIETKQTILIDRDESNHMFAEIQRGDRQLIEDDISTDELEMSEHMCVGSELMKEKQQFRKENYETALTDVRPEEMDFLEKLRILHELERVEEQLLENDKILDFLTSDDEEMQDKIDELINETVEKDMKNKLEICQNSDLVEQDVTAILDVTAMNELKMQIENKGSPVELKKLLHRKSEEMIQQLTNTEVLVLAPIIENYAEMQEQQKKFQQKKVEVDTKHPEIEIEHQKEQEIKSQNNISDAFTMTGDREASNHEFFQTIEPQLQETPNEMIKNELQIEEENLRPYTEQENQVKQIAEEDNETVKGVTKEILELIMKCFVSEKIPVNDLKFENLEEKVKEKLEEKVVEKIINQTIVTKQIMEEKQPLIDAQQLIKQAITTKDFKIEQDAKQPERGLQLRDIINETNEIDEVKIVTAVVVLMTNIIERVCQQQL